MFYIHSTAGRVFGGSLEQLREQAPVSAVVRARRIAPLARDPHETPGAPKPAASGVGQEAMAAYASAEQGVNPRQPLTKVSDVMSRGVHTVSTDATALQAWQQLANQGVGQAPVVDAKGTLVGLFLRADLMRADLLDSAATQAGAWRQLLAQPVHTLMWTPVPVASPDADLRRVATVLLDTGLPGLPVSGEDGLLAGFVSRSDILRAVTADPPLDLWG